MALATRGVGVWQGMSAFCSNPRVVCGVEPTRKTQQSISLNSDHPSSPWPRRLSMSSTGDAASRCQAATLTAVREAADVEIWGMEEARTALRDNFEAASASGSEEFGLVSQEAARRMGCAVAEPSAAQCEPQRLYHGRRGGGDGFYAGAATAPGKPVEDSPTMGKGEMLASFEAALHEAGRNAQIVSSLAARAWRSLGDADRAEALFLKALELAPQDSTIHASYAEFLWQCDA